MKPLMNAAFAALAILSLSAPAFAGQSCKCSEQCMNDCKKADKKCDCKSCGCSKGEKCDHEGGKCNAESGEHKHDAATQKK